MTPIYFLHLSKVWRMLHHGSVRLVHKKCYLIILCTFLAFLFCCCCCCCFVFHHKICVFIIFISFSDKVSNFRNKILTNQKRELVSNCQRNWARLHETGRWTQTGLRFYFGVKFHFGVRKLHYQRSHDFTRSETHFGANFTLVNLTEVKFQTAMSFPCKQQMLAMK